MDEAKPGIKIARRNTHNLWYTDDIALMGETEEELSLLLSLSSLDESERGV